MLVLLLLLMVLRLLWVCYCVGASSQPMLLKLPIGSYREYAIAIDGEAGDSLSL